jgi:peptide/nickel transport system permease protein
MSRFVLRRLLLTVPVLFGVATLVFALIHVVPGDPAEAMLGETAAPADLADLRARLGLDKPLLVQYGDFLSRLGRGDLGTSFRYGTPVLDELLQRVGPTALLASAAMAIAVVLAVPLGVVGAIFRGRWIDRMAMTLSLAGMAMPNFWLGPVLAMVFGVGLSWLPISGFGTWQHLVLPALTLGAALAATTARMTRASLADELGEMYVRAARGRGLAPARVAGCHRARTPTRRSSDGNDHHRNDLCVAGHRTPADSGDLVARLPARTGVCAAHRLRLRGNEPHRGRDVRLARSPDSLPMNRCGFWIVGVTALAALVGPLVAMEPTVQELPLRLAGPSWAHPLGLDELGRDVLARLLSGARISLVIGVTVVAVSAAVGVVVGAIAGYVGGWVDEVVGRIIDVLLAFPGILLAIALVAVLGPGLPNIVIALSSIGWVGYARLVRGQVLKIRELEYVQAARVLGASTPRILLRHVVPATWSPVTVQATLGMAGAIVAEASLSFLGLGVQPPTPSWGTMIDAGRAHLIDAPHLTIFPGLALALLVAGFNLAGDALRDRLEQ